MPHIAAIFVVLSMMWGCTKEEIHEDLMVGEAVLEGVDQAIEQPTRPQVTLVK